MATTPWVAGLYNELVSQPAPQARNAGFSILEFYDRSTVLPPLPPGAEHYYADLLAYKNCDARTALLQQILDEDTRSELLAAVPFVRDEWEWFAFGTTRGLAALVPWDDFVNAPSSGGPVGPASGGRSARFGFSIAAFR